jgi:Cu/Zn superoxide dismutase
MSAVRLVVRASCLVFLLAAAASASAEVLNFQAGLSAGAEVPATSSNGSGRGEFEFETTTNKLTFTILYRNLSGPATAAHIHGPAQPGSNAGVVVTFLMPDPSPIKGTEELSPSVAAALLAGELYVNIHTDANKSGEIRGQITIQPR